MDLKQLRQLADPTDSDLNDPSFVIVNGQVCRSIPDIARERFVDLDYLLELEEQNQMPQARDELFPAMDRSQTDPFVACAILEQELGHPLALDSYYK